VPGDDEQVMYVWFDALINYISTLGWPENEKNFKNFWPGMQVAGKDNLRQQSAMWQAMLMSAGLPNSKQILIHGFITANGQKMSKSLGNVIDPFDLVKRFGTDAVRYWLLRELNPFEDGDYTDASMIARYNGDLANNLGNLVSRVAKLSETLFSGETAKSAVSPLVLEQIEKTKTAYHETIREFRLHEALAHLWELFTFANVYINDKAPWKTGDASAVSSTAHLIQEGAKLLEPFLPETAKKILEKTAGPLFPKLS
jgi:methionyl-tRNA synthetase